MKLDLSYTFDENLQESANSPQDIRLHIENLLNEFHTTKDHKILSEVGVYYRIIRELDKSLYYLNLARENGYDTIAFKIRLAHTYQWMKNFEVSNKIFDELLLEIPNITDSLIAFIHQHRGKNFFDQGLNDLALKEFEKALEIRIRINAPLDQIDSTKKAIERVTP